MATEGRRGEGHEGRFRRSSVPFPGLVLTLVSERSLPGVGAVTEADRLQREIVQLLCVEPLPHSQLVKLLPRGGSPAREAQVEQILARVAHFRRERGADPAATASTRYSLPERLFGDRFS